jgi:integrase/recombinase XerD
MEEHARMEIKMVKAATSEPIPAFAGVGLPQNLRAAKTAAVDAWLIRTPSEETRRAYASDLEQFLGFVGITASEWERLATIRPEQVSCWRDALAEAGLTNSSIRRKLTTLRSLFSYLQTYGYTGANPAHGKFVKAPAVPRDGKTVALSPHDCRRLLEAPQVKDRHQAIIPAGVRDRAMLAVFAYSGCRVRELVRLRIRDYKTTGEHRILNITGKGGKERSTPLHLEAVERLNSWLAHPGIADDPAGPMFPAAKTARGLGRDGFRAEPMSIRAVEKLIER